MKMFCLGYVIEYDFFLLIQLCFLLEICLVKNLFFVGQINGIIGYEEVGSQGLIVGINVYLVVCDEELFIFKCFDVYIGVFIDDFINKGIKEFYWMFILWVEYCILLWQDNVDICLMLFVEKIGMCGLEDCMVWVVEKEEVICEIQKFIIDFSIQLDLINGYLNVINFVLFKQSVKLNIVLLCLGVNFVDIVCEVFVVVEGFSKYDQEL